jgi:hypothetical protein
MEGFENMKSHFLRFPIKHETKRKHHGMILVKLIFKLEPSSDICHCHHKIAIAVFEELEIMPRGY